MRQGGKMEADFHIFKFKYIPFRAKAGWRRTASAFGIATFKAPISK